jgi:hypothetical protein
MISSRAVTIVVGAGLLAAWFAAANGSRPAAPRTPLRPTPPDPQLQQIQRLLEETNRLHGALASMAAPRQPARNPFQFDAPDARSGERGATALDESGARAPGAAPAEAAVPSLNLEGVADDGQDGLTAIIAGGGRLFLVRVGDLVTARYRVKRVSAGAVDLEDLTGGPVVRLELH